MGLEINYNIIEKTEIPVTGRSETFTFAFSACPCAASKPGPDDATPVRKRPVDNLLELLPGRLKPVPGGKPVVPRLPGLIVD